MTYLVVSDTEAATTTTATSPKVREAIKLGIQVIRVGDVAELLKEEDLDEDRFRGDDDDDDDNDDHGMLFFLFEKYLIELESITFNKVMVVVVVVVEAIQQL